jgi:phosphate transport system ATP-binding protein
MNQIKLSTKNVSVSYGTQTVLHNVSMDIPINTVTALIGPSGCGKSTYIRLFNRMNDFIENFQLQGEVYIDGQNIYNSNNQLEELRKTVGMVFQKPNPFPKSIYENVAYGLRIQGIKDKAILDEAVETALKQAALFDEVKDNLKKNALSLSGGQQQRLCIARTLAVNPTVLLMDEPASALDPISTAKIEQLIAELKKHYTILIVTHNMQQAVRVSDQTAFLYFGELIEFGPTKDLFSNPKDQKTAHYVGGKFG